jgi:UDP-3-O-[3-hydroxymyristoyl] N-acetylglucosamine deacetylase
LKDISQKTIKNSISCKGISLHKGLNVTIRFLPAPENSGIIFRRVDISPYVEIKANYKNVTKTNLGTVISNNYGVNISTIEHLMAAIWSCKIDNMIIEIDDEEVPILDGSSAEFIFMLEGAGLASQNQNKKIIKVKKDINFKDGEKFIKITPSDHFCFDLEIDFNHKMLGKQKFSFDSMTDSFKYNISRARTFCFESDLEKMHQAGLAKGGSLANAIVIGEDKIINKSGLRMQNEFSRHKALDFIGDISLSDYQIIAHFYAFKPGHTVNNKMLHYFFNQKDCWDIL